MKISKKFTTVTPLSKFIAMVLFIIFPFVGFYLGLQYQKNLDLPYSTIQISPTPIPKSSSGITGVVTIGPTSPVCVEGKPCSKPYSATILVLLPDGQKITEFKSDASGNFNIALNPGKYILESEKNRFPQMRRQMVEVFWGQYTTVNIYFDSGIR